MSATITNTPLDQFTLQGAANVLSNGFGVPAPQPDSAALILGPQSLLTQADLSTLTLADVQIDDTTVVPLTGAFSITNPPSGTVAVVSFSVNLTPSSGSTPIGMVLYDSISSDLFYVALFNTWPGQSGEQVAWNASIVLGLNSCS